MRCETCIWFEPSMQERALYDGRCTVDPPTTAFDGQRQITMWPDVLKTDRCSKHSETDDEEAY